MLDAEIDCEFPAESETTEAFAIAPTHASTTGVEAKAPVGVLGVVDADGGANEYASRTTGRRGPPTRDDLDGPLTCGSAGGA